MRITSGTASVPHAAIQPARTPELGPAGRPAVHPWAGRRALCCASAHGISGRATPDGAGSTIAGSLTRPEPTATAPASKATSTAAVASRRRRGRLRGVGPATGRGTGTAMRGSAPPIAVARSSISSHKSGARHWSRLAKRRRRSSIAVTQELAQVAPTAAQVGPHGQAVRAQPVGDLRGSGDRRSRRGSRPLAGRRAAGERRS